MDSGHDGLAGGSSGDESEQENSEIEAIERRWEEFKTSIRALIDESARDLEEKSEKIRKLTKETVWLKKDNKRLEETVECLKNQPIQEPGVMREVGTPADPFLVFPPEVWKMILDNITRYADLNAVCKAFPQLDHIVKIYH